MKVKCVIEVVLTFDVPVDDPSTAMFMAYRAGGELLDKLEFDRSGVNRHRVGWSCEIVKVELEDKQ